MFIEDIYDGMYGWSHDLWVYMFDLTGQHHYKLWASVTHFDVFISQGTLVEC